jgi:cold shock CspA family protein
MSSKSDPRHSGVVVHWNVQKRMGFIRPNVGGPDIYTNVSQLRPIPGIEHQAPLIGTAVDYVVIADPRGRPVAADVHQPLVRVISGYAMPNRDEVRYGR